MALVFVALQGDTVDDLASGISGTNHGAQYDPTDKVVGDGSYDFESSESDWIDYGDITVLDGATSVIFSAWFRPESLTAEGALARKWRSGSAAFSFSLWSSSPYDEIQLAITDGSAVRQVYTDGANLSPGTRYHIVATWRASDQSITIWVDGVEQTTFVASAGSPTAIADVAERMAIGARYNGGTPDKFIDGKLHQVAIWKDEFADQSFVDNLYNSGAGIPLNLSQMDFTLPLFETVLWDTQHGELDMALPIFEVLLWDVEHGEFNFDLPLFEMSLSGESIVDGPIDFTLPIFTVDFSGYSENPAQLNFVLPLPEVDFAGTVSIPNGTMEFLLPMFEMDLEGESAAENSFDFILPLFSTSFSGNVVAPPGSLDFLLPIFRMSMSGVVESLGTLDFDLPMFYVELFGENGTAEYRAVALNTETMAITEYDSFPFNSFCEHGGKIYGATDDGIYLLEGDDDAGTKIDAYYKTAVTDFGTSNLKRVNDIIARFKGAALRIKVVDDREYAQTSETITGHAPSGIHTERSKPGRGMKSTAFGLDVENVDGGELTPLEIEMRMLLQERKI